MPDERRGKVVMSYGVKRHSGYLKLILGPMFSGKTTILKAEITRLADLNLRVLLVRHGDDNRVEQTQTGGDSQSGLSTHHSGGLYLSPKIDVVITKTLSTVDVSKYHAVGIDEGQFFEDLLEAVPEWINVGCKIIFCASLDGDAFMRVFGKTLFLIPLANDVIKIPARCQVCLEILAQNDFHGDIDSILAPFTARIGASTEQKLVGGADLYIPVCRYHHLHREEKGPSSEDPLVKSFKSELSNK